MMLGIAVCIVAFIEAVQAAQVPTVDIGYAQYRGNYEEKWDIDVYNGIRYAAPPKRWWKAEAPKVPSNGTTGILDATMPAPMCIQFGEEGKKLRLLHNESEDCLFLNVYTPGSRQETNETLPVLVWIHSGDYQSGRADADPRILMQTNENSFIFVDIQYRLGVLGFLSFDDWDVMQENGGQNNLGLQDQRLALRWVRDHIHKFGGDGKRVTLGGHSSGGGAVILQSMAEVETGEKLFQNAIVASPFLLPVNGYSRSGDEELSDIAMGKQAPAANRHDPYMPKDWNQHEELDKDRKKTRPKLVHSEDSTLAGEAMRKFQKMLDCDRNSDFAFRNGTGGCLRDRKLYQVCQAADWLTYKMGIFGGTVLFSPVTEGKDTIGRLPEVGTHWGLIRDFPSRRLRNTSVGLVPKNMLIGTSHQDGIPLSLAKHSKLSGKDDDFEKWFESHFARRYHHGFASMAWEERSLVEAMYANDTVSWLDINGNIYDFNSRSLAEGSPELVNRFPTVCNEHKWSARQQMVNRIVTEVFYHCPAEWTASALAGSDSKTWRYEVRHEQNLHGDDLQMTLPSSSDFDLEDEKWLSRAGIAYALQRMWGKFITQDTPVISLHDAHYSNRHAVVPVSSGNAEKNTSDTLHWPQYPWMVVLDSEGGQTEIEKPLGQDFRCPVRIGPDDEEELYLNRFSLANSVTWNKDRGARCRWWQENGHKIPL